MLKNVIKKVSLYLKARKIYNSIMLSYRHLYENDRKGWSYLTSAISFEEVVWKKCIPDKQLAIKVMDIAGSRKTRG